MGRQNKYMSQFRVKGSAVRLIAAVVRMKLLSLGEQLAVKVELRVGIGAGVEAMCS
jgi:hypothetical protein